jgi:hypothetical protein
VYRKTLNKPTLSIAFAVVASMLGSSLHAGDIERRQAKRIHDRLAGAPPTGAVLDAMEQALILDGSGLSAAQIAVDQPGFYNVTLKNWATPWTSEERDPFAELNDYSATIIGMVRDGVDFREVLYGDVLYHGAPALGIDAYNNSNNAHYRQLEQLGPVDGNLADPSILVRATQSEVSGLDANATAGVVTSRAGAKAFFYLGTNRAMFRFTLMNHLCTDLEPLKDNSRSPDRVRQDVSRSPGGDSRIYLNSCVGCHAGMDGLAGAYAHYDLDFSVDKDEDPAGFDNSARLTYDPVTVSAKHLINANNFITGFETTDDGWINYWRNGPNAVLGWNDYPGVVKDAKGNAIGHGAKSMGMELANSEAFARCQVKKAFQAVCLRDPDTFADDRSMVDTITADFTGNGYRMKPVFQQVAAYCMGN